MAYVELYRTPRGEHGMKAPPNVQLRTVGRAAGVLELLIAEEAVTLKEVQRKLHLGHTVAHRILRTWTALGFISFDETTKVYRAGEKLLWAADTIARRHAQRPHA